MQHHVSAHLDFGLRLANRYLSLKQVAVILVWMACLLPLPVKAEKFNVLFVAVDDLTCSLGCYGDRRAVTPNFDRLAASGVRFDRAYCQLPLCNPSRASVMTGRRPDDIRVYDLDRHFRDELPDVVTLPQLFKNHGWFSARVGKLYHYNVPAGIGTAGLDDPPSWDQTINPKGRDTLEEDQIINAEPHRPISAALSWLAAGGTDEEQTDGMVATKAIELMEANRDQPFFLGVGFFRPHTPYVAPAKYFTLYPLESLGLPFAPRDDRSDIPYAAFAHNCKVANYGLPEATCIQALQGYYASVSFVDAQLGRLLRALDELNLAHKTIVVIWSDHGYHLGEHLGIWQKRCLFEESARAPLLIYSPTAAGNGIACDSIVEFVDIYPTVADICGLPADDALPGRSLKPLLDNPTMQRSSYAVTQVLRPDNLEPEKLGRDQLERGPADAPPGGFGAGSAEPVMGRSIRNQRWRYTEWNGGSDGRELYDHHADPHEFRNVAELPEHQPLISELRAVLDTRAARRPPTTPFNPARL